MSLDPTYGRLGSRGGKTAGGPEGEAISRGAIARARVRLGEKAAAAIAADPAAAQRIYDAARLAGIQGAKRAAELIPLAPPHALDLASVDLSVEDGRALIRAEVRGVARGGLEIEAMAAATIAALALYDMCRGSDLGIVIEAIYLEEKWGGMSGPFRRQDVV